MALLLYRLRIRVLGLIHGEEGMLQGSRSPFGSCTMAEPEVERYIASGLTAFGPPGVAAQHALGLVTDLAHIDGRAFFEVPGQTIGP